MIYKEGTTNERHLALKNLFKAQGELFQKCKKSQSLQEDVNTLNIKAADGRNKQLTKANLACNCMKEMLKKVKLQLVETKKMYDNLNKSKSHLLAAARLNEVLAEKAKLEKEILHLDNVVEQRQSSSTSRTLQRSRKKNVLGTLEISSLCSRRRTIY